MRPDVVRHVGLTLAATCLVLFAGMAEVRTQTPAPLMGAVSAVEDRLFGRLVLQFPEPIGVKVQVTGAVMVVMFDRPVQVLETRIAAALPSYVAAARVDPDFRSLRLALVRPVRAHLKDAAERTFIDFLPAEWKGPPPPLPPDVVEDLARRARASRADAAAASQPTTPPLWPLRVVISDSERRLRFAFVMPPGTRTAFEHKETAGEIRFSGPVQLDPLALRAALSAHAEAVSVEPLAEGGGRIAFAAPGFERLEAVSEEDLFSIDLVRPAKPEPDMVRAVAPAAAQTAAEAPPAPVSSPVAKADDGPVPVQIALGRRGEGFQLSVRPRVPMAAFEHGGLLNLVLRTVASVTGPERDAQFDAWLGLFEVEQHKGWAHLKIEPKRHGLVSVAESPEGWFVTMRETVEAETEAVRFQRASDPAGRMALVATLPQPGEPIRLGGERPDGLLVIPMSGAPHAVFKPQTYADLRLIRTALGIVVEPRAEDLLARVSLDRVEIGRDMGLALSQSDAAAPAGGKQSDGSVVMAEQWNADRRGSVRLTNSELLTATATVGRHARTPARQRLAEFYLANTLVNEAIGVLTVAAADDAEFRASRPFLVLSGIANVMRERNDVAAQDFGQPLLANDPEAALWRTALAVKSRQFGSAMAEFRKAMPILDRYPDNLQALLRPILIETALEAGDFYFANAQLGEYEKLDPGVRAPERVLLLAGRIAEAAGMAQEATSAYASAARAKDRSVEAEARYRQVMRGLNLGSIKPDAAIAELETIAMIWRRGEVELRARARLADLHASAGEWRAAFLQARRGNEILPEHPVARGMQQDAARRFSALFLDGKADSLNKVQALAIFEEFRTLIPPGAEGDAIVTNLAERLHDLDLVEQAAELLAHQVQNRLKGLDRARAGNRLALMHLASGKPNEALQILRQTRVANLPAEMKRARMLMEARAQTELSRGDLSLDILAGEAGSDAERLRADVHWRARRWRDAGESYERALGSRWQDAAPLSPGERADVIRAGIAFVLTGDTLGRDRLRAKFLAKMSDSEDAAAFKLVTMDGATRPDAFRDLARSNASTDTLSAFLEAYRARYPGISGATKPSGG